mmetsp:Transcript_29541/g.50663  ORF Transcript_29541/g.50663 Transcript_29541/m.50663 type:complete len:240 (-) Transcript_29541:191-910(-)|eukprot:CAMPEP_0184991940 /NCGR_PEP_ID=MMETSP1098-20130426/38985_1 /TAXON_ID=89044 /ORGANISM="Spumella elongata, Strain CCAP 955/1" /LENGTH=239 /DNA_ID=CAMNT_0027517463 /DNA_START=63 /DNA_END=782 /DNA_ORIENTATION=+
MSIVVSLISKVRAALYLGFAAVFTADVYEELRDVLAKKMKDGDLIIEIGPGTGSNLKHITDIIEKKNCHYRGIDYDADYIVELRQNVPKVPHEIYAGVKEGDFLLFADKDDPRLVPHTPKANVIIMMIECTMLMPQDLLRQKMKNVRRQITEKGNNVTFIFAHTEFYKNTLMGWLAYFFKPYLKYVTTIDFGIPTYKDDFENFVGSFAKTTDTITEKRLGTWALSFGPINLVEVECSAK